MVSHLQKQIINDIFTLFVKENILLESRSYEEFNVVNRIQDIDNLINSKFISGSDRQATLVSMAIMYVNMCMIFAKSNLPSAEYKNFMVFFRLMDYDKEEFAWVEIFYTRHSDSVKLIRECDKIDLQECEFYDTIKNVIGIIDFNCYYYEDKELGERYYSFVPKILSHSIA